MKPLTYLIRQLPPTRVLIGAGFALASYFVTNIWKAGIDDELKTYASIADRASVIGAQLASLPAFQASSRYWATSIELQRTQVAAFSQLAEAMGKPGDVRLLPSTVDPQDSRAIFRQEILIQEFFMRLPAEVASLPLDSNVRPDPMQNDYDFDVITSCMRTGAVNESADEKQYRKELAAVYEDSVARAGRPEDLPTTFEGAAKKFAKIISTGQSATTAILAKRPANPSSTDAVRFSSDQRQAVRCIERAENQVLDKYFALSNHLRDVMAEQLVKPRSDTRRTVERVEIALYGVSGLIALLGSKQGPSDSPPREPARRSAADIERLRRTKPQPIHRRQR